MTFVKRLQFQYFEGGIGAEAIDLLQKHTYSVILLDLMMPRVDGFGVIDFLKTHPHAPKPIVLVITAYADQNFKSVDSTIVAGVLRKPFEVGELGNLIRLCVSGYQSEVSQNLHVSRDRAIREFARFHSEQGSEGTNN